MSNPKSNPKSNPTVEMEINEEVKESAIKTVAIQTENLPDNAPSEFDNSLMRIIQNSYQVANQAPIMELTASYLEIPNVGGTFRGAYAGKTFITITDKATGEQRTLESVVFVNNGKRFINSGVQLVDELTKFNPPLGTGLEITLKEKKGNTKIYSISVLH